MRTIAFVITIFCSTLYLQGQNLINKNWTKFHIERFDGSRIISRTNIVESPLNYYFQENGKVAITTILSHEEIKYALIDSIIAIGSHQLFQIETLTDSLLILIELLEQPTDIDKINKIFFSSDQHYANNIISKKLVQFINDSTIASNSYLHPRFTGGSLERYLYDELATNTHKNFELQGSFIITPRGQIFNLEINNDENDNTKIKEKALELLLKTNYRWQTPSTKTPYYYKVNFTIKSADSFIGFSYFEASESINFPNLSIKQQERAIVYFQKGNRLLNSGNYEKAILNYNACIEIDEIFLDAYYNRAYANKMLGNLNKSCTDWGILSELGQTEAIKIFNHYCEINEN